MAPEGTINFASNLTGTITLTQGELDINNNVTIQELGANQLTISGNNQFRDFNVGAGVNATISGLTIANGLAYTNCGGGIFNEGTLTLNNDTISGSKASIAGGGILNDGTLNISNSLIANNTGGNGGGGLYNTAGSTATINLQHLLP